VQTRVAQRQCFFVAIQQNQLCCASGVLLAVLLNTNSAQLASKYVVSSVFWCVRHVLWQKSSFSAICKRVSWQHFQWLVRYQFLRLRRSSRRRLCP
jgi:hypothetical protein